MGERVGATVMRVDIMIMVQDQHEGLQYLTGCCPSQLVASGLKRATPCPRATSSADRSNVVV